LTANLDQDEIKSMMSEFLLETDPFENGMGPGEAVQCTSANDLEMHGPPNNDDSREIFIMQ